MTEVRCIDCNKLLGKANIKTNHDDFEIELKCPRCKSEHRYKFKIKKSEDLESQD